jgi:peptidoglycan/LPS O-acetylase OafA/YrhL
MTNAQNNSTLPWLDGVRGFAAFWVFVSHVLILCGARHIPILSEGGLAVDLFMLLSGFLMTHHYVLRRDREPWGSMHTWRNFWVRRYFRIAPLYYLLLLVALLIGPYLGLMREEIAKVWPATATAASRYQDASLGNILSHVTFVFGALPKYSFETPLPDWSIGLEMQFYLAFPFLMWSIGRFGAYKTGAALILLCLLSVKAFREFYHLFEMPSFLPMKLHIFFIGMWLALGRSGKSLGTALLAGIAAALISRLFAWEGYMQAGLRVIMVVSVCYLMSDRNLPSCKALERFLVFMRRLLSNKVSVFLGDTSYGFYLVHLLILLPVAGTLASIPSYVAAPMLIRFFLCAVLTALPGYAIAWLLHRTIELKFIWVGKLAGARIGTVFGGR